MSARRPGSLRLVSAEEPAPPPFASEGRPAESRRRFDAMALLVRLIAMGWGGAVIVALVDSMGAVPHLPFVTAMGLTAMLVVVTFIVTRDGVPDWRGDAVQPPRPHEAEDASTDLLTDLPTFNTFQRRCEESFLRSRRMGKAFSVVLVDVNNLTAVNKEYGVRAGDEVLRHVARAIDGTRRYADVVARLGDDEFGVLLVDCAGDGVRAFIDRLEDRLSRESAMAEVDGRTVSLWAGICTGTATSDPGMGETSAVLEAAIEDLDQAKHDRERRRRMWLSA